MLSQIISVTKLKETLPRRCVYAGNIEIDRFVTFDHRPYLNFPKIN